MTPRELVDRITALCDNADRLRHDSISTAAVRALLAEVSPEPGDATSDDHQQGYAQGYTEGRAAGWDERGALVRPVAGGVLNRDQARAVLLWAYGGRNIDEIEEVLDRLAAAVRPGAGVWVSPEQARRAAGWYFQQADDIVPDDADRALVAQLEEAS